MQRVVTIVVPIVSLVVVFSLLYLLIPRPQSSAAPVIHVPTTIPAKPTVVASLPKQLEIPSIAVVAPIYPIGLTVDGDMAINETIDQVAWYQYGPIPGETGSAVIAGHYGWKDGVASVFTELHTLKTEDSIVVRAENNEVKTFVVRDVRSYLPDDNTTEVFRSTDGKAHLNLITCEGTWDSSKKTYSERLVIFTDLVE